MSVAQDTAAAVADIVSEAGQSCEIDGRVVNCLINPETFTGVLGGGVTKDGRDGTLLLLASDVTAKPGSNTRLVVGGVPCQVGDVTDYFGAAFEVGYTGAAM